MKQILLLAVLLIATASCVDRTAMDQQLQIKYQDQVLDNAEYKIYTIDGCEYIVVGSGRSRWGSHKGNCKNHAPK